jgi:beta-amylase
MVWWSFPPYRVRVSSNPTPNCEGERHLSHPCHLNPDPISRSALSHYLRATLRSPTSPPRSLLDRIYKASDAPNKRAEPSPSRKITAPVRGVPVYVMLPLDTVWLVEREGVAKPIVIREKAMEVGLEMLKAAGVEGVMVDVWWGIVEHAGPGLYDFTAYRKLFDQVAATGLKIQAVMSFHAAGGNVGDTCTIPLPPWVLAAGAADPDIFYTDAVGLRNRECLSVGCDDWPVLEGRTPVQAYSDFISAFADEFGDLFGRTINELIVGLGPAGELRYPSYPEGDGRWRFPGVGEFQCHDRYMLESLKAAAVAAGHPEWGHGGPHDAGTYNSLAPETGFFKSYGGSWEGEYGRFFLEWYSGELVRHADRLLGEARRVLTARGRPRAIASAQELADGGMVFQFGPAIGLGAKLAGVHWWFKSRAHAAELTAGYYNTRDRNGYGPVMEVLARYSACASFTCVEMRDCEHPLEARCSPEGLLNQVLATAAKHGVPVCGENALQRYDRYAFDRIAESAFGQSVMAGRVEKLTFLRMGDMMIDNWESFSGFLRRLTCPPGT